MYEKEKSSLLFCISGRRDISGKYESKVSEQNISSDRNDGSGDCYEQVAKWIVNIRFVDGSKKCRWLLGFSINDGGTHDEEKVSINSLRGNFA